MQLKLRVLQGEQWSCHHCTDCCRNRLVPLSDAEATELSQLNWPNGDPLEGQPPVKRIRGKAYLRQRADGSCVFLNEDNGMCRVHETFFADRKPLACQVFPFRIIGTMEDEVSVLGSYECPTVRRNEGEEFSTRNAEFTRFAVATHAVDGINSKRWFAGLTPREAANVVGFLASHLSIFETVEQEALFIYFVCDYVEKNPTDRPTKENLNLILPTIQEQIDEVAAHREKVGYHLPRLRQAAFRALLAMYLRDQEDEMQGRVKRLDRMIDSFMIAMGAGNFASLGPLHPAGSLSKARLFTGLPWRVEELENNLLKRMVRTRLLSRQFMGRAMFGANFFFGLRMLALTYPLVMAAAKYRAGNRKEEITFERASRDLNFEKEQDERAKRVGVVLVTTSKTARVELRRKGRLLKALAVTPEDIEYGVRVIDRAFGRSPFLRTRRARLYTFLLMNRESFTQLVMGI